MPTKTNRAGRRPRRGAHLAMAVAAVGCLQYALITAPSGDGLGYWAAPATPGLLQLSSSPSDATTDNWSGYVASGPAGAYKAVAATFTVPRAGRCLAGATMSQWVGVDGWANGSLLQAGVNIIPEGAGRALFEPWWEVVPGPQHLASGVMVRSGDSVRVALSQLEPGRWSIELADNTNGDTFRTVQHYDGPLTSAEWVVEANTKVGGAITPLATYTPQVVFSRLAVSGLSANLSRVVMVQAGQAVSTPSQITTGGFAVAYGASTPTPPRP